MARELLPATAVLGMSERELHAWLVRGVFALGAVTFVATSVIKAPYGRYARPGWGPTLNTRLGWVLMEMPSALGFALVFALGDHCTEATPLAAAALWCTHYFYRTFVYPFLIRTSKAKRMPLTVVLAGDFYNTINAYVNARYLSQFGDYAGDDPFARPSFYVGTLVFVVGLAVNIHSDQVVIHLRKPGETGYAIPRGGMFALVSAPNYFGELLEWCGWSVLSGSPAGWSFAFYSATNLVPRAVSNHQWYLEKFKETYPKHRKAVIPWLW
ncbi:hypothetical protein PybrP1_002149 [[Pythium] brassicae (nom. inval.)]|nr:hypothetical protein PybrP1_002149 [[Pythium] brassicae (nom. inval.)]